MFKDSIIRYRSRRSLKNNKVERENPSFYAARIIGVIFTWEGEKKGEVIRKLLEELDLAGKKFEVLSYHPHPDSDTKPPEAFNIFTKKDFSYFGLIRSEKIDQFINTKFDFLFHLDTLSNLYIENILARCQAKCRVSRFDLSRKEYYDFMIKAGDNQAIDQLCKQIMHYTKSLVAHG